MSIAPAVIEDEPEDPSGDGIRGGLEMLAPYRKRMVLAVLAIFIFTGASLAKPLAIQYALDHGVAEKSSGNLLKAGITFLVLIILVYIFQAIAVYSVNSIGQAFLRALRVRLFAHYQRMSLAFFGRENAGRLVSRMTSDIQTLNDVLNNGLLTLVQAGLTLIGAIVILLILSWQLTLVTALILPPLLIATVIFRIISNKAYLKVRERIADVLVQMQETFSGLRVVQAFGREGHNMDRFGVINERNYEANVFTVKISAMYLWAIECLGGLGIGVILYYGGRKVAGGDITVGTVAAFVFYLDFIFQPIQQLSQVYDMVQSAGAALNKIFGLLNEKSDLQEDAHPEPISGDVGGRIGLHGVTFGYNPITPVLSDI
ncbi:MAG: ABC transporter ATP-binding protein, partial [Tepidiformaceae bacterium]